MSAISLQNENELLRRQRQFLLQGQQALQQRNARLETENTSLRSELESWTSGDPTVCPAPEYQWALGGPLIFHNC
jgi:cell shape-determining protein MreC